jgi:hypothetical protein
MGARVTGGRVLIGGSVNVIGARVDGGSVTHDSKSTQSGCTSLLGAGVAPAAHTPWEQLLPSLQQNSDVTRSGDVLPMKNTWSRNDVPCGRCGQYLQQLADPYAIWE